MWTRKKKSLRSRTKRTRRQRSKFITPDLALWHGQLLQVVAPEDSPLAAAERLAEEYAALADDDDAAVSQFLQRAYFVVVQFWRRPYEFERLQVHPFWKQSGRKLRDPKTSKSVLCFVMRATTTNQRRLANKYAVILDGLMQDQVVVTAVVARIKELGGIEAAYEAMRRRHESSSCQIGESGMPEPTKPARRRRPQRTFPLYPLVAPLFETNPPELLAVEEIEGECALEAVPGEAAFDFVQRVAREYAEIKDGDHQAVRRVLQRAYLAARKMQREPNQFDRLQDDRFWNTSLHRPIDASTSKWVVHFIMQARTPNVRNLAGRYVSILDGLIRDKVPTIGLRVARMEGVEAAYEAWQGRQRLRGLKSWPRRQDGNG
jgi:hypothetical protein